MYNVEFVKKLDIKLLERDWRELESGKDMTYFQRYDWYEMLIELNRNINSVFHEILFAAVQNDKGKIILIAPLWIVKIFFGKRERKGVYLFGRRGWNDYCNYIYDTFDEGALLALFDAIKKRMGQKRLFFENLKIDTALYLFLSSSFKLQSEKRQICVAVNLPSNKDSYLHNLSKHAKQNLRTARNRALKDDIEFEIIEDDKKISIEEFQQYRTQRVEEKNGLLHGNICHQIRNRLSTYVRYQFPIYTPMENDKFCHYLSCRNSNNELMGSFCYGLDVPHKEIVIMAVSLNMKYKRYSPCMLAAFHYILSHIESQDIYSVNFTRGNEDYKYYLGGKEHYCHTFGIVV